MTRLDKSELVRVVRTSTGAVMIDAEGNAPGRGAYLCAKQSCVEAARKKKRLSRVLRTSVEDAVYDEIIAQIEK